MLGVAENANKPLQVRGLENMSESRQLSREAVKSLLSAIIPMAKDSMVLTQIFLSDPIGTHSIFHIGSVN